jgi:hypothetical protein
MFITRENGCIGWWEMFSHLLYYKDLQSDFSTFK